MQTTFEGPIAGKMAVVAYLTTPEYAALSEPLREQLLTITMDAAPPILMYNAMELLYANYADIGDAGRDLVGSCATFLSNIGNFAINDDNRGYRISLAMRRENGEEAPEGVTWPDPETDPEPLAKYSPQPEPEGPVE